MFTKPQYVYLIMFSHLYNKFGKIVSSHSFKCACITCVFKEYFNISPKSRNFHAVLSCACTNCATLQLLATVPCHVGSSV